MVSDAMEVGARDELGARTYRHVGEIFMDYGVSP